MSTSLKTPERVAIIGAGPIGLEAALRFQSSGFDTHVFERGTVAANVRDWGHVRLFSPFDLNSSALGRRTIANDPVAESLPPADALLSGREFAQRYLLSISRSAALDGRVHEQTEVLSIGRTALGKTDRIGSPRRAGDPFQLLLRDSAGERNVAADVVLDCSGTYPNHRWIGAGGIPCVGETTALNADDYRLPDVAGVDREKFQGRTTLVVGGGYSAATAVVALAELAESSPETRTVWITRSTGDEPLTGIPNDQLSQRKRLTDAANQLARAQNSPVEWLPGRSIRQIEFRKTSNDYALELFTLDKKSRSEQVTELIVDRVIANVGYRPQRAMTEELQFHECYATQGPIKLAAALLGETSTDCLSQESHGADTLRNPEPNFFVLGAKSYGRDSRFLIKTGLEQIEDVFGLITMGEDERNRKRQTA